MICIPMEILAALILSVVIAFSWQVGVSVVHKLSGRYNHSVMIKPSNLCSDTVKSSKLGKEWLKKGDSRST